MNADLKYHRIQRLRNLAVRFDAMLMGLEDSDDAVDRLPFYNQIFLNYLCEAMEESPYIINSYKHFELNSPERSLGLATGAPLKQIDTRMRHLDLMRELHDFHTYTDEKRRQDFYYRTLRDYWNSTRPWWHLRLSRL